MFCSSEYITTPFELFTRGCFHASCDQVLHSVRIVQPIGHGPEPGCSRRIRKFGTQEDPRSEDMASASRVSIPMHPLKVLFSCLKVRKQKFTPIQRSWPQQSSSEQRSKCYTELDEVLTRVQVNTTFLNEKSPLSQDPVPWKGPKVRAPVGPMDR